VPTNAVIVAAGSSTRFGNEDKLFAPLCGRPVLAWSLAAYEAAASIDRIVVVAGPDNLERITGLGHKTAPTRFATVVAGGARRRDSVEAGLRACVSRYVAIHDGARPLTSARLIDLCVEIASHGNGAILATPVTDTIKEARDSLVIGHPERAGLWAAQTPQVVLRQAWLDAAAMSDNDETDDAAMLARLGLECAIVESTPENLKITRTLDLEIARLILASRGEA
jgi:2-C-methyl-D-erythritol 4-phosphate cytidylyltransferase